ncbi:alpha-1-acid glycoprotein-like [Peromyscus maniculatus bairdii]|uniref:alpha-1-acid glycoprotein-like n=1 Tax=Peromyscus maniculatus bairdii TaxID=230844 RepID=UPI00042AF098|nr:alpha-1-acid glycoprotein-like [Peromyscus maniculatus bairdii]
MALRRVLVILSLLPLLEAQNPEHANITGIPITNDTLSWLSGKWFYIGSALHNLVFKQAAQKIQAEYFYFTPNVTDDTILLQEYQTMEDRCVYNVSKLGVQRENGTISKLDGAVEFLAHLKVFKRHGGFLLAFAPQDEKNRGLSLYANKPDVSPELLEEFQKAVKSLGMKESEIIYTDWKKDMCSQQQEQSEQEKKTEEGS